MAASPTGGADMNLIPFNTIHVAHALVRAQQKGFAVPGEMKRNALTYLTRYRKPLSCLVQPTDPLDTERVCSLRPQLGGDRDIQKAESAL